MSREQIDDNIKLTQIIEMSYEYNIQKNVLPIGFT